MPNQFNGQVFDTPAGNKLEGVKVTITGPGIPSNTFTTTDSEGKWLITLSVNVDPKDITVTFSKSGLETTSITNPQQTAEIPGYIDPVKGGTLDLQGLYESGKWKVTSLSPESKNILDQELEDLFQFIKLHPGNTKITITSSESQVTNADNDGGARTTEFRQNPGALAKARAEALQQYVNEFLDRKYQSNPDLDINFRPQIQFGQIDRQGNEPWERYFDINNKVIERPDIIQKNQNELVNLNSQLSDNNKIKRTADLPKYTKDQYTRINVDVINTVTDCLNGNLVFDIMYLGTNHQCNSAMYQLKANGRVLLRDDNSNYASLNNNIFPSSVNIKTLWKDVKNFENVYTDYHKSEYNSISYNSTENRARFTFLKKGDKFPINSTEPPTVVRIGGHRFNRFIINSSLLKELTTSLNEKIITFSITCYRPESTTTYKDFWGPDCHEGVGSFKLYKVKFENNSYVVKYASDLLEGKTPSKRNEEIELFKYNVCTDEITDVNPKVFSPSALNSIKSD